MRPLAIALLATACAHAAPAITRDELVRRTQELFDAVAAGDARPWQKYYADDAIFADEKGRKLDKKALVADIAPLPKGYSGTIKVVDADLRSSGGAAVLSYACDESEEIFGQHLTARYHATDTWLYRKGAWQIIASQTMRYYEDPAPGRADPARFPDYVGTYDLAPEVTLVISVENGALVSKRTGRPAAALLPEAPDLFFRKGVEGRFLFHRDDKGAVDMLIDRRNNEDVFWKKRRPTT